MSSHTLKLHVENPGTAYSQPGRDTVRSAAGHVWLEVIYADGTSLQAGFAPQDSKSGASTARGHVVRDDGRSYSGAPTFTAQYEITEAQAETLRRFRENPTQFGFDTENYHALTNSCVDYVWKALEQIGMNPLKKHGDLLPIDNIDDFLLLKNPEIRSPAPSAMSLIGDAWDFLRPMPVLPDLPWDILFDTEPQGTVTVGPLGEVIPDVSGYIDHGPPIPQQDTYAATPAEPESIVVPAWWEWDYGNCMIFEDSTPGVEWRDLRLCNRSYSPMALESLSQPLWRMGNGSASSAGRNDVASSWIA